MKIILHVDMNREGLFRPISAYYGTVEPQGHLTLHLHILVWIQGSFSPQQIRDRLRYDDAGFQSQLIKWLERCHRGEFATENMKYVGRHISEKRLECHRHEDYNIDFEDVDDDTDFGMY